MIVNNILAAIVAIIIVLLLLLLLLLVLLSLLLLQLLLPLLLQYPLSSNEHSLTVHGLGFSAEGVFPDVGPNRARKERWPEKELRRTL